MRARTPIEWTDTVWNPVTGCDKVSAGCKHCYAETIAHRFWGDRPFTDVRCHPERLELPLSWKKPRRVFVNSMSDLFHEDVPDEFLDQVFEVMRRLYQHTFQVLTKRPERPREYLTRLAANHGPDHIRWPLPNVWLGVSCEDQATADERIPILLQTPAAVRWVSAEPLLSSIDLSGALGCAGDESEGNSGKIQNAAASLNWVVIGGESGPQARPCDVQWIRSIVRECRAAGVPCFVQQLGAKSYVIEGSEDAKGWGAFDDQVAIMDDCGQIHCQDPKGGEPSEWPADLRIREWPR